MLTLPKLIPPKLFTFSKNAYHPVDSPPTSPSRQLPTACHHHHHRLFRRTSTLHILILVPVIAVTAGLVVYHFVFRLTFVDHFIYGPPNLPIYEEWAAREDMLPQHNLSLPFPEGQNGRYVMFANQQWGYGLNNNLQEVLLLSHLAYLAGRSYVFQPYTWNARVHARPVIDGRHWRSSVIPLSVFLAGPTAGGAFARDDPGPRSVNLKYWDKVCPRERRTVVRIGEHNAEWGIDENTQGKTILQRYADLLREMKDPCIEVVGPIIFDFGLFASPRVLSIWPSLSISPILTRFQWSSLILNAVTNNLPLFHDPPAIPTPKDDSSPPSPDLYQTTTIDTHIPVSTSSSYGDISQYDDRRRSDDASPPSLPRSPAPGADLEPRGRPGRPKPVSSTLSSQDSNNPSAHNTTNAPVIPGLVALHLRRGDFRVHCHWLADRSEPFAGWNQFTYLLDRFTPPPPFGVLGRGRHHETYMQRCWPTTQQIVKKLDEVKRLHPQVDRLFLLTNGDKAWLEDLKRALGIPAVVASNPEIPGKNETAPISKDLYWEPGDPRPEGLEPKRRRGISYAPPSPDPEEPPAPPIGAKGWKSVITSKDVILAKEEREVDQAVDMEIARRAEVFVGNGFSSLTSNIVMLRLSDNTPIENIRFW